jgi:PAS domain S-box-containing protein
VPPQKGFMKKKIEKCSDCDRNFEIEVLRAQIESSLAGILVVGEDKRTSFYNRQFVKLWRIPKAILETKDDERMIAFVLSQLSDPDYFLKTTNYLYAHKNTKRLDVLKFKDGRFFERYSSPLYGANRLYYGRIWYFRDISEKKRTEEALEASESKCRMIFDNIDDMVFLVRLEEGGRLGKFFDMNKVGRRRLGYSKKELLKLTPWEVVTPESSVDAKEDLSRILKNSRAVFEREIITKNGSLLPVEISVRRIKYNSSTMLLAIARDIKRKRQVQWMLQAEKDKLQRYLDVASVLTVVFDADMRVKSVNRKWNDFFKVSSRRITGKDWVNFFVFASEREQTKNTILSLPKINHGTIMALENSVVLSSGERRDIFWRFALMPSTQKKEVSFLGVGLDVTEFKKAKATIGELKELNRLKDEFLNIATHELKTPLTSIIGLSEVLIGQGERVDRQRFRYLKIIHEEGLRLAHTMRQMLEVARYESGRFVVAKKKFVPSKMIEALGPSLSVLAKDKDFRIVIAEEARGIFARSDKQRISQVIYDLVDNAAKHSGDSKIIEVSLSRPSDGELKVEVIDDGVGISPEMQGKLFSKFFQLNPSLSRPQEGIGLGLYSCKLAVESLGGKIGLKSSPGKGANFYFTIPIR